MRVVLDTNIVVSALLFPRGRVSWIGHLWTVGHILPLVSKATARELIRVLVYPKFRLDGDDIQAVLASYLPFTEIIDLSEDLSGGLPRCRDPHDQVFLDLAWAGRTEVLVSGDAALLEMVGQVPFAVETPAQFRKRFRRDG